MRARSAPPSLASDYNGSGIPPALDSKLTERFGPVRTARAKLGRVASQKTEFEPDDMKLPEQHRRTRVNPTRIWTTKVAQGNGLAPAVKIMSQKSGGPLEGSLADHIDLQALKRGELAYKWTLSANGTLFIGETKPIDPATGKRSKQGHPTLVGGRVISEARFGGVLHYDVEAAQVVIDNDSGRFSEHSDLTPEHLDNVAQLFKEAGLEVGTCWKNMCK